MKKINKSVLFVAATVFLFSGCNKFDESINRDTNNPTVASGTQLIANSELSLPTLSSSPQGEYYAQFLSEALYPDLSLYNNVNFSFYTLYTGPLQNLESVLTSPSLVPSEGPISNQLAVAKILKAYFFWHITDRWGDVPFSEALKGKNNYTPAYDTQQSIYNSLFKLLDEANSQIVAGDISNDIVYNGNMERWKKLGNTLHLLIALRLSKIDPNTGKVEFNKALAAGIMESNEDNLVYKHLANAANENYWYDQISNQNRKWWALSKPLVDYIKPLDDPRLKVYGDANKVGDYTGLEFGLVEGVDKKDPSLLGLAIRKQDAPVYLVTFAQALFAKAEAAKMNWIPGADVEAKTNYDMGIEQSVRQWNNDDISGLAKMKAHAEIQYNPANGLKQIAYQRWVHLFMNGFEAWAEWRRTGYPELSSPVGNPAKAIPRRQAYPTEESSNNKAHYSEAIQRQFNGADDLTGRLWWDKP